MAQRLIIGTRKSRLALVQTTLVRDALAAAHPDVEFELREIVTQGDRVQDRPIADVGETGVFTREIERQLLEGDIDLAVHSLKDLPVVQPDGLVVAAAPERADAHDVLVFRRAASLKDLPAGSLIGTSSPRRCAQVLAAQPDLICRDLRGSIDTRLAKLRRGDYDAIVMAKAALDRLGGCDLPFEVLDYATCLPAPGQGALAVEIRDGDLETLRIVSAVNCARTFVECAAERMLLERLGGGCRLPLGALGEKEADGRLRLRAALSSADGSRCVRVEAHGPLENPAGVVDSCYGELARRNALTLIS